jgi:hypothetical protein
MRDARISLRVSHAGDLEPEMSTILPTSSLTHEQTHGIHILNIPGFDPRQGKGIFRNRVQTGSEAHPTSYLRGSGVSYPGSKVAGA